ncbi:MAG: hypothetical protein VX113_06250 [Pseudomonadota bacterium]|nr:hypothetical protein [Pseudomonadota bacterium]
MQQPVICTRWVCRTPDQDGLGIAFPATAEVEGYTAEKAKGHVIELAGGATWNIDIAMGLLTVAEAAGVRDRIDAVRNG